jgi:bacillithiol biosynthesis cysteine-adding enzyme BshC
MTLTTIPHSRLPQSTNLLLDYLDHYERVAPFYNGSPFDSASYAKLALGVRKLPYARDQVADILQRQNESFGCGPATFVNIDRLRGAGTFAVVTGQQVGTFSGPAYTLYKALTAIRLAQALSEQGIPAVPVFWLASEDHDLEEVAEAEVLGEDQQLVPLRPEGVRPAPQCSVGQVKFSPAVGALLDRLEATLPLGPPRDQLLQDLRESYRPGATWSQAFGRLLGRLFSRWGLVLLDPLDEAVHSLSAPVYGRALKLSAEIRGHLIARSSALLRAGYQAQVHVGEDTTLLFVEQQGNRLALRQKGEEFSVNHEEKFTQTELQAWLGGSPLEFSPNVLLRPIVQDLLLPTVAYVGGPSEIAYLGQAQAIYATFGRPMPVIFPRAGFTLVDHRLQRWLEKYGLILEDVWQGEEHLNRKMATVGPAESWTARFDQTQQDLARSLVQLRQEVETLDPTLVAALERAREKMMYQLEKLKGKISRAAVGRSTLMARHQQALLNSLLPHGDLQERRISGIYFLGRAGYGLLESLMTQIRVDSSEHHVSSY